MNHKGLNRKIVLAALFALFLPLLALHAQGDDPVFQEPAAEESAMAAGKVRTPLMLAAKEVKDSNTVLHQQVNAFLKKLANNADFARRFDEASASGDPAQILNLVREGGVRDGAIEVHLQARGTITITIVLKDITIVITIRW